MKSLKGTLLLALAVLFFGLLGCSTNEHATVIKEALDDMRAKAADLGEPKLDNGNLFFGDTKLNNNFELVDALQSTYGCTATFFMKDGDRFVRVSTDVMNNGERAVGTILDPDGPVIVKIREAKPFYGVVDILGNDYETGYEPIIDSKNEIIGVYYIGFQLK